jgi:hypothetical protein
MVGNRLAQDPLAPKWQVGVGGVVIIARRVASSAAVGGRISVSRFSKRKIDGSWAASAASPTSSTPMPGMC